MSSDSNAHERSNERSIRNWLVAQSCITPGRKPLASYVMALMAVVLATGFRQLLDPILENRVPYGFHLLAVVVVAWRYGLGPALVSVVAGAATGVYFFVAPRYSFAIDWYDGQLTAALTMFLIIGVLTSVLSESLRLTALDNVRLYQRARQAELRKDDFLAMLSHELRNPLVPIRNGLYALELRGQSDPALEEIHALISRQVDHLVRLVDDLLDVARITQGKIELHLQPTTFETILSTALEIARSNIEQRKQELTVSVPPTPVHLLADPVRLAQVVANLLNNAANYTQKSGQIWLTLEVEGDEAVVRVRDNGAGIPADMLSRIFDLFEQAPGARERCEGGLGIGLTLVRELVELHGGSVQASSPGLGLGSEFVVRVPGVISASVVAPPKSPAINGRVLSEHSRRVLVVDDNTATAQAMALVLGKWQHDVRVSYNGFSALEIARTFKPDIVLADLGLPQMNGFELARELRQLPGLEHARLIAVTGYGQDEDRRRSLEAGFDQHLLKPVDPVELERLIASTADCASA